MAEEEQAREMSFFDHLDDLRSRIVKALMGVVVGSIISGIFIQQIIEVVLFGPAARAGLHLQNLSPFGLPVLYFKVIFISGFIIAAPWILWNLWQFVAPGLYEKERSWVRRITWYSSLCFLSGVAFAYFVMIPFMMNFSANFKVEPVDTRPDISEYLGVIATTILAAGLIFELPMITYVLARFGIVSAGLMRKYRRHAIVVILIIAAVLTPTPDPINQLIFAAPLLVLYELSIIVAQVARKKSLEQEKL